MVVERDLTLGESDVLDDAVELLGDVVVDIADLRDIERDFEPAAPVRGAIAAGLLSTTHPHRTAARACAPTR
jgi:hypothetical protein